MTPARRSADEAGDEATDAVAVGNFARRYGERAALLPPVVFVIAAYDEEQAVGSVVAALPPTLCGLDTTAIVVTDGCRDRTADVAAAAGALVCEVPVNRGQGAALRLGYRLARSGGARYIVTTDADGQYDAGDAASLLQPILAGDADFVTGSRRLGSEETADRLRHLGVRCFAAAISALTGQRITDPSFGLRAMRADVTGSVRLHQQQYQAAELLIGVIARGFRVAERPATIRRRAAGESKKGRGVLDGLHSAWVNNACYGGHFAAVIVRTWWRERRASRLPPVARADNRSGPAAAAWPSDGPRSPGSAPVAAGAAAAAGDGCGDPGEEDRRPDDERPPAKRT